jgi:ParB-like chromosome segregation protein Spo0J
MTTHTDRFQFLPELAPDEYAVLKADIAQNGVLVPVEVDEHGTTLDGHHRVRIWSELRASGMQVADYPRLVREFRSDDEKVEHALRLNLNRRHLDRQALKGLAFALWDEHGWAYERIAATLEIGLGTAHSYVTTHPDFQTRKSETVTNERGQERPRTLRRRARTSTIAANARQERQVLKALGELEAIRERRHDAPPTDIAPSLPREHAEASQPTTVPPAIPTHFDDAVAQHNAWLAAIRGDIERMESRAGLDRIIDTLETTARRMEALGIDSAETRRVHILAMRNMGRVIGIVIDAAFDAAREALTATSPTASQLRGWQDAIVAALDFIHPDFESPNDLQQFIDALEAIARWCNELADLMEDALQSLREEMEKKRMAMATP